MGMQLGGPDSAPMVCCDIRVSKAFCCNWISKEPHFAAGESVIQLSRDF